MSAGIRRDASSKRGAWNSCEGIAADEYVCSRYAAEGFGGIMCIVFYNRNVTGDIQFHIYGNEEDDGGVCQNNDVRIPYNLQFFASDGPGGEKTEPATQKKLEDARKEGQVPKSREIGNGLGLLALFLILKFFAGSMGESFLEVFSGVYNKIPEIASLISDPTAELSMTYLFKQSIIQILMIVLPVFLIGFLIAFLSEYMQVKWKPTGKPLMPKFSKLNPISGFKRIFSANALVELVKAIAKILLILYVAYSYLKGRANQLFLLYDMSLMQGIELIGSTVIDLGIRISAVYMILALGDFAYQKFKFSKDMRMTKQEVKEEYKNQEGNPEVKGKIRQRMREVSQRRMMQSLPKADVVITNPTHYAVALKYDPDQSPAPIVIAKGEDYLAKKIKEVAKENHIEIVENKPLARMLYANVEVGAQIPPELYQAVADVLAFVYNLKGKI